MKHIPLNAAVMNIHVAIDMKPLTDIQKQTLDYIIVNQEQAIPPMREMANYFGVTIKAIYDRVNALEKKGYIKRLKKYTNRIKILDIK